MRILMATPELAPLARVGGIAEYVLGLGAALSRRGHDVRVALPSYEYLRRAAGLNLLHPRLVARLGVGATEVGPVHETEIPCPGEAGRSLRVLLVGEHRHFSAVRQPDHIYAWPNHEPWVAFSRAVIDFLLDLEWTPDVIHCQDSHTALIPVYMKHLRRSHRSPAVTAARTVLTIHNLLNQGAGSQELVAYAGMPPAAFHEYEFEYHGLANSLKAGLLAADHVTTVSKTYAAEIRSSSEFGFGLEGVLAGLPALTGIVNGIDEARWKADSLDYSQPSASSIADLKQSARRAFLNAWGWPDDGDPIVAFRSRWDTQKGVVVLASSLPEILKHARVVLGVWGTPGGTNELQDAWAQVKQLEEQKPDRLKVNPSGMTKVEQTAIHYTIADFFLLPSRYEPCGLTQLECQRFGTVPIVRGTGGLADTVFEDRRDDRPSPNGFVFQEFSSPGLLAALERALTAFRMPTSWSEVVENTLRQSNGWDTRVPEYERVLSRA